MIIRHCHGRLGSQLLVPTAFLATHALGCTCIVVKIQKVHHLHVVGINEIGNWWELEEHIGRGVRHGGAVGESQVMGRCDASVHVVGLTGKRCRRGRMWWEDQR